MNISEEIETLIRARSDATVKGDLDLLDTLLTSDFRYINRWGDVIHRAAYFKKKSTSSRDSYWIAQTIDEVEISLIQDNVAVANFRVLDHQMFEGQEMKDYMRTSYVCVRQAEHWKLMFGQTSPIEPE